MSEMRMAVKVVTGHSTSQFEELLGAVIETIEKVDGVVFPIQYQYNVGQKEHTAIVQYQSEERVKFPAELVKQREIAHGYNPRIYNEDGSRKAEAPAAKADVVNSGESKAAPAPLLPPAE